jgi:hypothetical protein
VILDTSELDEKRRDFHGCLHKCRKMSSRREQQADIARNRAEFFAHGGGAGNNPPSIPAQRPTSRIARGPAPSSWPGPFTTAQALIAGREAALKRRTEEGEEGGGGGKDEILDSEDAFERAYKAVWKPSRDLTNLKLPTRIGDVSSSSMVSSSPSSSSPSSGVVRRALAVAGPSGVRTSAPSLASICIDALTREMKHIDDISILDPSARRALAAAVSRNRAVDNHAFTVFAAGAAGGEALAVPDCAGVDEHTMTMGLFSTAVPLSSEEENSLLTMPNIEGKRLTELDLGHCGRGFSDRSVRRWIATHEAGATAMEIATTIRLNPFTNLLRLRLAGAYALSDEGLLLVLQSCKSLESLTIIAAPLVTGTFIRNLPDCASRLSEFHLESCPAVTDILLCGGGLLSAQDKKDKKERHRKAKRDREEAEENEEAARLAAMPSKRGRGKSGGSGKAKEGKSQQVSVVDLEKEEEEDESSSATFTESLNFDDFIQHQRKESGNNDNDDDDIGLQRAISASMNESRSPYFSKKDAKRIKLQEAAQVKDNDNDNNEDESLAIKMSLEGDLAASLPSSSSSSAAADVPVHQSFPPQSSSGKMHASGIFLSPSVLALPNRGLLLLNNLKRITLIDLPKVTDAALLRLFTREEAKEAEVIKVEDVSPPPSASIQPNSPSPANSSFKLAIHLEAIHLERLPLVTDRVADALSLHASTLKTLSLQMLKEITGAGLERIAEAFAAEAANSEGQPADKSERLASSSSSSSLTDWGLQELSLKRLKGATSRSILALIVALARGGQLARVNLSGLPALTDAPIVALGRHSALSLRSLDISFSTKVSDEALGECVDNCPNLSRLVIWGNTQLTGTFFLGHKRAIGATDDDPTPWIRTLKIFGKPGDVMPAVEM